MSFTWRTGRKRWFPQLPLALAMAPLGILFIASAAEQALGGGPVVGELAEIERRLNPVHHGPVLELALGISLLATSIGIALRSRLAWLWSITVLTAGLTLRVPPDLVDVPLALYTGGLLVALLLQRHHFATRSLLSSGVFAAAVLFAFVSWATAGTLRLGDQFEPPVEDLPTALYFTIVAVSSVGFGDIVARETEARLFVLLMISLGLVVGATALSSILVPLFSGRMREILGGRGYVERSNHYVIVGKSPLARNAAVELEKRKQHVTLVLDEASEEDFYRKRDVVVGDPTDLSVLRAAGAGEAKGVLALSTNDADNGFVVLGANELNAAIPTVAALNDPSNEFRLKRAQPSMLLSLQALGGELLAMALTGERVDLAMLTAVLQIRGVTPEGAK
jgi:voltage-gated potassium channel